MDLGGAELLRGGALDLMVVGSFGVMGLVTLLFFVIRRRDPTPLWMGLFCFAVASHFLLGKPALTWYASLPLLALFVRGLYPSKSLDRCVQALVVLSVAGAAATLLLPAAAQPTTLTAMRIATMGAMGWLVFELARASWKRRSLWAAILIGMPVLYPVMIWGLLAEHTAVRLALTPFGLVAFFIAPVVVLARRIARALEEGELRSEEDRQALRDQAKFTDDLLDSVPVGVAFRDPEGRYLFVNKTWTSWFGGPREKIIGTNVRDRVKKEIADQVLRLDREALERGTGAHEVREMEFKGRLYTQIRNVVSDAQGRIIGVVVGSIDTTDNHARELKLRDQMTLTRALIDENPNAMYLKDAEARYVTVNDAWLRMVGKTREQTIGRNVLEIFGDEASKGYLAEDLRLLSQGEGTSEVESLRTGPDGAPQWLIIRKCVLRNAEGGLIGLIGVNTDITPLKRFEIELAERNASLALEQRRLALVVRASQVGIVDWDGHTHEVYYSPRFREILGHAPDADTTDWPDYFKVLLHPDDRERYTKRWQGFIKGKGAAGRFAEFLGPDEHRLLRKDGSYVWVEVSGVAVRDENGFVTRWIAATTDITERRAQEEALRQSVQLREEVERMSRHDLKTPINSVIAVSRLLRENSSLAPEDAQLLATVERAGYRILNMVNLSLDLFRMEQGIYEFRPQPVDLDEVAAKVATDLQGQAASKNVMVRVTRKGSGVASAEELLCYSIFANLVKNAIEAAPEGTAVSIEVDREGEWAIARVHNVGAVPENVRARFFQKYATAGKSAGLGLGAYSAHLLARVQNGDLTLHSSASEGTTLTLRLRAAETARPRVEAAPAASDAGVVPELPPLRVVVADDDEINRLVLQCNLPSPPLKVTLAVNGRAAIDAAAREWPDVALIDLEMPVMDGYEAARRLREMEREKHRKRLAIVAISSSDEEVIVKRALAAGCDHYLVKPVPRELLWQVLGGAQVPLASGGIGPADVGATDEVLLDPDLEAALPAFLASRRQALEEMPRVLAAGDRAGFKRLAHRLTGSFGLYGFRWAAAQAKALERDALEGNADDLAERTAMLRAHLDAVKIRVAPKDPVTP